MLEYVGFRRVMDGAVIEINTNIYPLHDFDPTVSERTVTDRDKMQAHGQWPTYSYRGGMDIHFEGDIFGDTSDDYWTNRLALVAGIFGSPDAAITDRKLGDLIIELSGLTDRMQTEVCVTAWSAPIRGLYPSTSEFAVTFHSWTPYFIGISSGTKYYLS